MMIHLGDITKISGFDAPTVDVIVGGSPCQDLSIAGKRAGLEGERSGLFMEQLRIIKEMRQKDELDGRTDESIRPRYMVWENVPGAFSSNKGEDFKIVLEETARVKDKDAVVPMPPNGKWSTSGCIVGNGWSIAWRVLDAQFYGVPQRRRRIALVADFGGHSAPEILFIRKSLSRDTEQSQQKGKETSYSSARSIGADDIFCIDGDKLNKKERKGGSGIGYRDGDKQYTLTAKDVHGVAYSFEPGIASREGGHIYEDVSGTLRANAGDNQMSAAYTMKIRSGVEIDSRGKQAGKGALIQTEKSGTLSTVQDQYLFQPVYSVENHPADSRVDIDESGKVQTLTSRMGTGGGNVPMVMEQKEVVALDRASFNQGKNAQYDFEINDSGVDATIVAKGPSAVCYSVDQGGGKSACSVTEGQAPTLTCTHGGEPAVCYSFYPQMKAESNCFREDGVSNTLVNGTNPGFQNGIVIEDIAAVDCRNFTENSEINGTLQAKETGGSSLNLNNVVRIAYPQEIHDFVTENNADAPHQQDLLQTADGVARTIAPGTHAAGSHLTKTIVRVGTKYIVRRLTPLECERLQGYPDGWTDIGEYTDTTGKVRKTSDASRYKALGNSIAIPPWKWVMKRISACYERDATLASLFDGIGGFPYIWEQLNGKGSCLWASEIEEFPIAVTKRRFGE